MRTVIHWCRVQWDRALAVALTVVGLVALVIGWVGVSGALVPAQQLPFIISGGIGSLFVLGIAAALWLSADLHDEWRKLDRLEQLLRSAQTEAVAPNRSEDEAAPPTTPSTTNGPRDGRPLRTTSTRR